MKDGNIPETGKSSKEAFMAVIQVSVWGYNYIPFW